MDHAVIEAELAGLVVGVVPGTRELERECDVFARRYLAEPGVVEPQFDITSANFTSDPFLICADRYWNLRFTAEPTLATAVQCAGWATERIEAAYRQPILEKWAIGYAFITRGTVESLTEIADATADIIAGDDAECSRAYFATLYHAGKLRANLSFDELSLFLGSSPLANAAGRNRDKPLFIALQAFAGFGSRQTTNEHAMMLFEKSWTAPDRTHASIDIALHALEAAVPFDEQGTVLRTKAAEAIAEYPDNALFRFRLGLGAFLCDDHDAALTSIDDALRLLPATGWRSSHELLSEQFLHVRRSILLARSDARRATDQQRRLDRYEQAVAETADLARRSVIRAVELVAVFAAVIAFAVGSLNVTLNGNLDLGSRLWILVVFGGGLLLFVLLIVGGTWLITRDSRRSPRE
ncbi:hypothetical protein [Nocardia cyriacigeorgica]|uniref:hypothetical protein n=1 Tax=Nocardia cyriacigeorgica TaxID=135487 RepID=UPI0018941DA4|nr:hypothetical protein [Nocardia cyriacigeorgica]MBF6089975.1 hypothetical protein [Nocardia cyriacigeorgica]MBF6096088.1 hypothetical protein [Nocardia cyriacigeorgica]